MKSKHSSTGFGITRSKCIFLVPFSANRALKASLGGLVVRDSYLRTGSSSGRKRRQSGGDGDTKMGARVSERLFGHPVREVVRVVVAYDPDPDSFRHSGLLRVGRKQRKSSMSRWEGGTSGSPATIFSR